MIIPDEQLDEFIAPYEAEFGITPDRQEAYNEASDILRLVKIIYYDEQGGPLTTNEEMVGLECGIYE